MATPMPVPTPPTAEELERFWRYVEKQDDGCWIWIGARFTSGYGAFSLRGKTRRAHRVLYVWTHGEHNQETLDHECENRACVNPAHLTPRSNRENVLLGHGPTAQNYRKEQTDRGEEYDALDSRGWRYSRQAGAEASRRYYEANREKVNANKRKRRRERGEIVVHEPRSCEMCGTMFTPQRVGSGRGRFCPEPDKSDESAHRKWRDCVNLRQNEARRKRLGL